jgi:hypothetical protein
MAFDNQSALKSVAIIRQSVKTQVGGFVDSARSRLYHQIQPRHSTIEGCSPKLDLHSHLHHSFNLFEKKANEKRKIEKKNILPFSTSLKTIEANESTQRSDLSHSRWQLI